MQPFDQTPVILVIADVEETRIGIERLLNADGYRVLAARGSADAAQVRRYVSPQLVLMTLSRSSVEPPLLGQQVRNTWNLTDDVPIVVFAVATLEEGAEIKIESNIYLTHPDNFNQLRKLISRLVRRHEGRV
jgi:CheY-like chemotaxis protein